MERQPLLQRFNALKQEAESWRGSWKDIQTYIAPTRGNFDDTQPNNGKRIDHKTIIDGHASRQINILSSGMTSGLTSPSRPWFKLGLADRDLQKFEPVKQWLADVQDVIMTVFQRSNVYGALPIIYGETGVFGTGSMMVLRDYKDVVRMRNFTCGEYYLGNGPDGRCNAFARSVWMTVSQIIKEFGMENVSETVRNAYQNKGRDQWYKVLHLIEENDTRIPGDASYRGMAYRSVYWEEAGPADSFLRVSGFHRFPVLAPRWSVTTTSDVYGRSPGWDCLGDVKMLQKMQKSSLMALDKVADPPQSHL